MVTWTQLVMVVGVTVLFLGSSVIPRAESIESIKQDSDLLIDAVFHDALIDEVRDPPQSAELYFLKYAFVWGTYENCTKYWIGSFEIWNDHWSNLTIHVIGYGAYGPNDEYIWMKFEAYDVHAQRHLGIIGPHSCCIFAWGLLTVYGVRQ